MNKGTVFWVTGFSGAGKTTVGKKLFMELKSQKENVVFLDGDILRDVFGNDLGYSFEDRLKSAMRNAKLSEMLSNQGIDVICSTISMFDEIRLYNRSVIEKYIEIYLKVPMDILKKRNQKGLYENENQVVGINIDFQEPQSPDILIVNDGKTSVEKIVKLILDYKGD